MNLKVDGASLHWQQRGEGPVVLMLQGGDGDADASNPIAEKLPQYRVVSYDRRGLSRSTIEAPLTLGDHVRDAAAVLQAAAGSEPAYVFGTSLGAIIGLELVARDPQRVKKLVAHEPPATELLDADDRAETDRRREEIEAVYRTRGVLPAMRLFLAATGVDFLDRESDVGLPPAKSERLANLKFFLEHDAPAVRRHTLDVAALQPHAGRIVVAAGEKSRGLWIHRCAEALAARLGTPLAPFPGDHGGSASHPRGFATHLEKLFAERQGKQ